MQAGVFFKQQGPPARRLSLRSVLPLCALAAFSIHAPAQTSPQAAAPAQVQAPPATTPAQAATPPAAPGPEAPLLRMNGQTATATGQLDNARTALASSIWQQRGKPVTAIQFEGVTFATDDNLLTQLTQKAQTPLDPDAVRTDIRRLFASGRYREISVRGEVTADGITIVYAGVPRYYVGRVQITGVHNERLASLLEFATKLDPGTAYTEALIPAASAGVRQSLISNGYFEPKIDIMTSRDDIGNQVNVTVKIEIGPQARVGDVTIEGQDAGITRPEFRKTANLDCGRLGMLFSRNKCRVNVTRDTTSTALSNLRTHYQKKDRLEASVTVQKQTYDPAKRQLNYDFAANQGPIVKVVVIGAKFSKSRLHLLVPVYEEGAVDNDLLNEGAYNIRDYLQQQGYFDVTAKVDLLGAGTNNVTVQYTVNRGEKHKVLAVNVKGNKYFDADTLLERLSIKKADNYQRSGRYSQVLVKSDISSIESLYRANGFNTAKVTSSVKDADKDAKGKDLKVAQIVVTFTVVEGPQQKFGSVDLAGVDPSRAATIKALLQTEEDQPFSLLTLSGDRDAVLGYYISHGFDQAKVEIKQDNEDDDKTATDVTLAVSEGPQVFIDKVLISGIVRTRPSVVQNQLTVHPGAPLDQAALLETQRNLYNLALFNEVNAAVQNPDGDAIRKNVLVQLTEARRWDVTYGAGFEAQTGTPAQVPGSRQGSTAAQNGKAGVSPRATIDITRINLRGTDNSLTLHSSYGLLERTATLSLTSPHLFNNRALTGTLSGGYSNVQSITTFSASTEQADIRVTQKVKKADTFIYDYQFRRVAVDASSLEITPNLIPQLSQPVTVGGPGVTFYHDTRDPSPLDAGRGQFFSIQEFLSNSIFGSDTNFNRVDATQSTYYTFGKKKYVFARNLRVGFENTYGKASTTTAAALGITNCAGALEAINATCNPIPLPERLYAGGATSHRGFGINDAGPRDLTTGYPVGGSAVVINTFELRLPPPTLPLVGSSISFVIFHDMGNVFQHTGDMFKSVKNFKQPNQSSCRNLATAPIPPGTTPTQFYSTQTGTCSFNYYSHAIGLGARYKTPVGPIRLDLSYNLNPPIYPVFYDYTNVLPYVGQASHFQFFFSIGQSF